MGTGMVTVMATQAALRAMGTGTATPAADQPRVGGEVRLAQVERPLAEGVDLQST